MASTICGIEQIALKCYAENVLHRDAYMKRLGTRSTSREIEGEYARSFRIIYYF